MKYLLCIPIGQTLMEDLKALSKKKQQPLETMVHNWLAERFEQENNQSGAFLTTGVAARIESCRSMVRYIEAQNNPNPLSDIFVARLKMRIEELSKP
jgi:hypothetical protein